MRKHISAVGLIVGALLGVIAAAFLGKWILWLGLGLAIGFVAGAVRSPRRLQLPAGSDGEQVKS
jgi:uncharacterized membrane protein YoaK (UPF0700 family)